MRSSVFAIAMVLASTVMALAQSPTYKLGRSPTKEELRPADLSIGPNGQSLPSGSGTAIQGATTFIARGCGTCHGPTGAEGPAPHLSGPRGAATGMGTMGHGEYEDGNWTGRGIVNFPFAPLIWSWINQAMPLNQHGFLTPDEVYRLTAFLLFRNNIIQEDDVMDAKSLPQVRMPKRDAYAPPPYEQWTPGMRLAQTKQGKPAK